MKDDEIKRIEKELDVELPHHYVTFLLGFNGLNNPEIDIENFLYPNPDHLIEMNRMIGFYSDSKIIKRKLIIGDNGGGGFYLIDLVNPNDKRVYIFDHEESVENNFDKKTETWNWEGLEHYETLERYKNSLQEMFGLE